MGTIEAWLDVHLKLLLQNGVCKSDFKMDGKKLNDYAKQGAKTFSKWKKNIFKLLINDTSVYTKGGIDRKHF
ncbi:hypothetical protein AC624_09165 [Bacillus sp. FJAT-27238]|nr:hypothetical protein AC624_09165 [Bacillus sp. FJAT-27238]